MFEETYEEESQELSEDQMDAIAELAYEMSDTDDAVEFDLEDDDYASLS